MSFWSVSTSDGVSTDAERLLDALGQHCDRIVGRWREFSADQWAHPSRNPGWSVHDTARHVADAMERGVAANSGDRDALAKFDARATPDRWLERSAGAAPDDTIERYLAAAHRFHDIVGERLAAGDDGRSRAVYGEAHWTMNVTHILWDSWIHERDIGIPLGIEQTDSTEEARLVGLYGVFMAGIPTMVSGHRLATAVSLIRPDGSRTTVALEVDGGQAGCREASNADAVATGRLADVVDAISGRGSTVADALPGAPGELGMLAAYMNS